jgi:hypothetical protein
MADNERPQGADKAPGAGDNPQGQGQQGDSQQPLPSPLYGAWQVPPPDVFREYSPASGWPAPHYPMAGSPGYPVQPLPRTDTPGVAWPPVGAMPPAAQGGFQGRPEKPQGFVGGQMPPPAKTSPLLIAVFAGMALLVILVPLLLVLTSHSPGPSPTTSITPQATTAPTATPTLLQPRGDTAGI